MGGAEDKEKPKPSSQPRPTSSTSYSNPVRARQEEPYMPNTGGYFSDRPAAPAQPRAAPVQSPSHSYGYPPSVPTSASQRPYAPSPSPATAQRSYQAASAFPSYSSRPTGEVPYYSASQEAQSRPANPGYSQPTAYYQEQRPAVSVPSSSQQLRTAPVKPVEYSRPIQTPPASNVVSKPSVTSQGLQSKPSPMPTYSYGQNLAMAAPKSQSEVAASKPMMSAQPAYIPPAKPTPVLPVQPTYTNTPKPAPTVQPQPAYIPPAKPTPVLPVQPTYTNTPKPAPTVQPQPAYVAPARPTPVLPVQPTYTHTPKPVPMVQPQPANVAPARPTPTAYKQPAVLIPAQPAYVPPAQPAVPTSIFFRSLDTYKDHFSNLLELERQEEAEVFSQLFRSARLSLDSAHGKRSLYSLKLKSVNELNFGDQFRLFYEDPDHEREVVHIHDLIEEGKKLEFQGKYNDGVRVEYYRSLPMRRMMEKLEKFDEEHPLLDLILGDAGEENRDWKAREYVPEVGLKLDDSQKEAISSALNSQLTLILGPPGSGKTSVAAELVVQLCKKGGKILVCAPSNVAADNLALRLKEKQVRVLRFYSKGAEKKINIADKFAFHSYVLSLACLYFPQYATQLLCSPTFSRNDVKAIIGNEEELVLEQEVLDTFQVVCSTCVSSADAILANFTFDSLLIDEAAFCCEPESLIPIVVSKCKKLVLIGDPEQLRPIIKSSKAKKLGLEISLFERLQRAGLNTQWLEVQYRMHPDISYYPRNCFYGGRLRDGITAEDRSMVGRKVASLFQGKPLLFVHIEGKEDYYNNTTSRWNRKEAETTISVLERLHSLDVPLSSIGLVTPYEGQRLTLVKRVFERLNLTETDIEIKNVDGYQGREKDFIVMSCVRSNARNIGFLANPNRINVALTRAKYGLVIVGNSKTLRIDKIWAGFVTCVEERGRIISVAELERQPLTG